jgi:hypothetical protein
MSEAGSQDEVANVERKRRRRIEKEERVPPFVRVIDQTSSMPPAPAPPPAPALSPEQTRELNQLFGDMLVIASDMSLEMVATDCPNASTCPIYGKGKELAKLLKKLRTILKSVPT